MSYSNCDTARRIDTILIDRNTILLEHPSAPLYGINMGDSTDGTYGQLIYSTKDVAITNNIFVASTAAASDCVSLGASATNAPMDGTIKTIGNTCHSFLEGIIIWRQNLTHVQHNHLVLNNLISIAPGGDFHIRLEYDVNNLVSNNNIFTGIAGKFEYDFGGDLDLAGWRTETLAKTVAEADTLSKECSPSFVSLADLHLVPSDTCARTGGADVSAHITVDHDNEARGLEIGADSLP